MFSIERLKERAKTLNKTIVLPEGNDDRILEAASLIQRGGLAKLIVLGNIDMMRSRSKELGFDLSGVDLIDPLNYDKLDNFSKELFSIREHKGLSLSKAKRLVTQPCYFAAMMVHFGLADGYVSGAVNTTANTLRPALQIIKTKENFDVASSFFIMVTSDNKIYFFADCAFVKNPTAKELSSIAISTYDSAKSFGCEDTKVAMLSFSTKGSAKDPLIDKVVSATSLVKEKRPDIIIDGELQLDAAIIPDVAKKKCPLSPIQGNANVLIFPDLQSANIGYKLVERFAHAKAIGPIVQGLKKPVNDLSRGCSVKDIVDVVAITAIESEKN